MSKEQSFVPLRKNNGDPSDPLMQKVQSIPTNPKNRKDIAHMLGHSFGVLRTLEVAQNLESGYRSLIRAHGLTVHPGGLPIERRTRAAYTALVTAKDVLPEPLVDEYFTLCYLELWQAADAQWSANVLNRLLVKHAIQLAIADAASPPPTSKKTAPAAKPEKPEKPASRPWRSKYASKADSDVVPAVPATGGLREPDDEGQVPRAGERGLPVEDVVEERHAQSDEG